MPPVRADYPPRHAEEQVTDDEVSPLEAIDSTDIEAAHAELLRDDAEAILRDSETFSSTASSPPCLPPPPKPRRSSERR